MHLKKTGSSRQAARVARRFSAYISQSLTHKLLSKRPIEPGAVNWNDAATLFCDVSGFSNMANELAADGSRGAEELNRLLLMIFTAMINAVHNAGGIVVHFHGDAMMVCIPDDDGQAAPRALACAQFMQSLMRGGAYSQVVASRPNNEQTLFQLSMKVGVGYGRCAEVVVGDIDEQLEYVVGGEGVDDAVAAEQHARAGQVVASAAVLEKAKLPHTGPFALFTDVMPVPFTRNRIHWDAYDGGTLWDLAETAAKFVPVALHRRMSDADAYYVAENRPITSMFVNFEGLDYADENVGDQLQAYYEWARDIVSKYGGENSRVNRLLTGDKGNILHVVFGAPVAPDDPGEALLCAWEMQKQKPEFITSQSIGVAAGEAFACAIGSQTRREYTIMGEVVNLSSRLMSNCPPDEVWVDEATSRRTTQYVIFDEVGLVPLKGYAEPLRLFKIRGDAKRPELAAEQKTLIQPLLWRENEVQTLYSILDKSLSWNSECVILHGTIPTEQARMASLGSVYWRNEGGRVIFASGRKRDDSSYGLWKYIWQQYFEYSDEDHASFKVRQIATKIAERCPKFSADMPVLEEVLGFSIPMTSIFPSAQESMEKQARLYALMFSLLAAEAEIRPLLLVLENLHWIDDQSLRFLHYVMRSSAGSKLALVLTLTPQKDFDLTYLPKMGRKIELNRISVLAGRRLVQKMLEIETVPFELLQHLGLNDNNGVINPIVLEENIRQLRDDQVIAPNGHLRFDETALDAISTPVDMRGGILSKLDGLSPNAHMVLQAASIIGRQFDWDTLSQTLVTNIIKPRALKLLEELRDQELIEEVSLGDVYLFQDELVQEIVYQNIPYRRRQMWHSTVAKWLAEQGEGLASMYPIIAHHYGQTDLYEDGLHFSFQAAASMHHKSMSTAIELYNMAENHLRGLGFEQNWDTAVRIYLYRAELYNLTEQFEFAEQNADTAVRFAHQHEIGERLTPAYLQLAHAKMRLGKVHQGLEIGYQLVERPLPCSEPTDVAYAHLYCAEALLHLGFIERATSHFEQAREQFELLQNEMGLACASLLWGYEHWVMLGNPTETELAMNDAERWLSQQHAPPVHFRLLFRIGRAYVALSREEIETAVSHLKHAEELCVFHELHWWLPAIHFFQSVSYLASDDWSSAQERLSQGLAMIRAGGDEGYRPLLLMSLAHIEADMERKQAYLQECELATNARRFDLLLQSLESIKTGGRD